MSDVQVRGTSLGTVRTRSASRIADDDDAALLARLEARDEEALRVLFDRYGNQVFGLALAVSGQREVAEDVTQETFLKAWTHTAKVNLERGSFVTYLCTVAHGRAVDAVRSDHSRRARQLRVANADCRLVGRHAGDVADDVADRGESLRLRAELRATLDCLPEQHRHAIELAFLDGHTYKQVSVIMGIPEGTAKSWIRCALRTMSASITSGACLR